MTLLEIIVIWFLTIIGSLGINILKDLMTIKDVADAGYLIEAKKTNEFNNKVREINKLNSLNFMLFPVFNIFCSIAEMVTYTLHRNELLMELDMIDCLRKMPDNLKEEYAKNPSLINAFKITLKDVSNDQIIKIPDKNGEGFNEIRYQYNENNKDFDILEVHGPAESLSYREQKEMVLDAWREIGKQVSYEYGSLEEFGAAFDDNKTISLDSTKRPDIEAESVFIKSIELCEIEGNESYLQLTLVDEEGNNVGIFGSPYLTTPEDFRKETFGILSAINCMDILSLGGNKSEIPIKFKCDKRDNVNEIINDENKCFHISDSGEYKTEDAESNESEVYDGNITEITSCSDSFAIRINSKYFTTHYVTGNLYYGFGYPLLSRTNNETITKMSACHYKAFIENLLKLFKTDDLLRIGGEPTKLPNILAERDEVGNFIAIGSSENDYHLRNLGDHYKMEKGRLVPRKTVEKKLI